MEILIVILLGAILITLLGAWALVGWGVAVLFVLVFTVLVGVWFQEKIVNSPPACFIRNRRRSKLLARSLHAKMQLGYDDSDSEERTQELKKLSADMWSNHDI